MQQEMHFLRMFCKNITLIRVTQMPINVDSHLYLTQFRAARRDQIRLGFENALEIWHFLTLYSRVTYFEGVKQWIR